MPYVTSQLPINIILVSLPPSIKKMRTNSLGRYTQSIQAKDICILLVNDDYVCRDIVSDMLDHCRYEAFSYDRETDAVNIIREKADTIELILTNVHRTYASRYGIIEHIEKKFNMKIILMSPDVDDIKNASRGGTSGVTVYFMKSLSVSEMNNLWATALAREKDKRESLSANMVRVENAGSKRTRENDEQNGSVEKKPRVVWTKEMHQKFLEAVAKLGHDKAFPKKIVELMNVPGLTRENVASHLQKYRMCMKRAQEGFTGSLYDLTYPFGFNIPQENLQQSRWNPFQMGPRNTTTTITRHFDLTSYKSRARLPQQNYTSLLSTLQLKPDHNFRLYGDQKKNVLLSIGDSRVVQSNTSFAGFRLTRDGKSVMFGENNHLSKSCIQSPSVHQQLSFPEMGTGDSSHCPSFSVSFTSVAPPGNGPVKFNTQLSSLAALLDLDEPMPPLGSGWTKAANFTEQPSSVATPWTNWGEPFSFTCHQQQHSSIMAQPQSAGLQWTDWAESPGFSPQLPPSGNDTNTNAEIFSDFSSTSLPLDICELGTVVDDYGVNTSAISVFDDLLFDHQELT